MYPAAAVVDLCMLFGSSVRIESLVTAVTNVDIISAAGLLLSTIFGLTVALFGLAVAAMKPPMILFRCTTTFAVPVLVLFFSLNTAPLIAGCSVIAIYLKSTGCTISRHIIESCDTFGIVIVDEANVERRGGFLSKRR